MEKFVESAASAYLPQIESMQQTRKAELQEVREQVRTNPEEVEIWFDKEIAHLESMNVSNMMKIASVGNRIRSDL